jgi:membrane protease YdiL (CAAX protease family)
MPKPNGSLRETDLLPRTGQKELIALKPADGNFFIYLAAFLGSWTIYVLWAYPHVQALGEETFSYAFASLAIRLVLWVLPVLLMVRIDDAAEPLRTLGLFENASRGLLIGLGLAAIMLAIALLRFGWPRDIGTHVTWNGILSTSLGIGFFEEIPFRGYVLQKLWTRMNFWLANILTSLIFVSVHLPGWFSLQRFMPSLALNVFLIGFFLGVLFRYSRSLWSCIIVHDVHNFISAVLFPGR